MESHNDMHCPECKKIMMHTGGTIPPGLHEIYECCYCMTRLEISWWENVMSTFIERRKKMDAYIRIECPQCGTLDEFKKIGEGSIGNRYGCPGCGSVIEVAVTVLTVNESERKFHETFNRVTGELIEEWTENKDVYKEKTATFGLAALVGYLIKKGVLE